MSVRQRAPGDGAVFVFSGHGAQWSGMALELLDASPLFASHMRACEEALEPHVGWSLIDVLEGAPRARRLRRMDVVQPALFAVTVSLAELWRACGVRIDAVVGHSQGEIAAAHIAGGLSLNDAAAIVARRAKTLVPLSARGGMVALGLAPERLRGQLELVDGTVEIGAINGPRSLAVTGERRHLDELLASFKASRVQAGKVAIDYAAHSRQVEPLRAELIESLSAIRPRSSEIPFFSTVTGTTMDTGECDAEHWYRGERQPVQFESAIRALLDRGHRTFIEVAPHPVLAAAVQETLDDALGEQADVLVACSLRRDRGDGERFASSLADVFDHGVSFDWEAAAALVGVSDAIATGLVAGVDTRDPSRAERPRARPRSAHGVLALISTDTAPGERAKAVRDAVLAEVASTLGLLALDEAMAHKAFKELGLESSNLVELRNRLRALTGMRIAATIVFDHPTPDALAAHLLERLAPSDATEMAPVRVALSRSRVGPDPSAPDPDSGGAEQEPIAIVGMSCRFPGGVNSPGDLWRLVASGGDAILEFPTDRGWDLESLYDPDPDRPGTIYAREGGFLYDAGHFDAAFFGISPREALMMDPQQRLFLEGCWEAVEHAGIDPLSLRHSPTGVFAGSNIRDYNAGQYLAANGLEGHSLTGSAGSILSGRVAYTLGLQGPAMTIDTACSSSLVTLHLACAAVRSGECSLALAGGVTVISTPGLFAAFARQRALARDGRCKPFADMADGTGWGEGVGVLLVERLSDARRNGHRVLALVRGSAVNQDGASNGLTAPSGIAQQEVIRQALQSARLSPEDVDVVEAHGTGTTLGDPIEAHALLATYGQRSSERPLWLGSVKSNIGHTQGAAGVAGLIKMVMAIRNGVLPRTLHVDRPSREVEWSAGEVRLLTEARPWDCEGRPRRAGVSSYGISGTNAHVILEQAMEESAASADVRSSDPPLHDGLVLWPISAKSEAAMRGQAERLRAFAMEEPGVRPADIARSLAGKAAFEHRAVVLGEELGSLLAGLSQLGSAERGARPSGGVVCGVSRQGGGTAFLFTGQGSQRAGMGRGLYEAFPTFKAAFDDACAQLDALVGRSLREVVFGEDESSEEGLLDRTLYTQAGLFALEVALFRLLDSWDVRPDYLIGHSIGELVAAHVAGVFSLEDACKLVAARGRLMDELPGGGAMLAVQATEAQVAGWLAEGERELALAAVNGPSAVVLSGNEEAVLEAARVWGARGCKTKRLQVSHAFHSPRMDAMLEAFEGVAEMVSFHEPAIPIVSNLTGELALAEELCTPGYWVRHVRQTVRFASGVQWLAAQGVRSFVELGPDGVLSAMVRDCMAATEFEESLLAEPVLRSGREEPQALLGALARMWVAGTSVCWEAIAEQAGGRRVELPTYAFQRERYWLDLPHGFWVDEQGRLLAPERAVPAGGDGSAERDFWQAVESEDSSALAGVLGVQADSYLSSAGTLLPALSAWRRRRGEESSVRDWRYKVRWNPLAGGTSRSLAGVWLAIVPELDASGDGLADDVIGALEAHGARVRSISLEQADLDREKLAAKLSDAVARVCEQGHPSEQRAMTPGYPTEPPLTESPVAGVLSLVALEDGRCEGRESLPRGLAGTLVLAQALGDAEILAPLWIATRGAVSVGSADRVRSPTQRLAWGLGRVLRLEDPRRWGGLVDLPPELDKLALERLCAVLGAGSGEDEVALRTAASFARRMVRSAPAEGVSSSAWDPSGTALITGGTGALGRHLALWLARAGTDRIVLAGRRGSEVPGVLELERELVALGARVRVAACDVSDRDQLGSLIESIDDEHPLTNVFHVAGVLEDELIDKLTLDAVDRVLRPKLDGAMHLHELTADLDLRAFVLFSSISATLGGGGQAAYAAGNAFLNALAEDRHARGLPATSVAWGAWAGEGMASGVGEHMQRRGVAQMAPAGALAALRQVLDGGETHVVIADLDWERYAQVFASSGSIPVLRDLPELRPAIEVEGRSPRASEERRSLADRLAGVGEAERERAVVGIVQAEAALVLGHSSADAVDPRRAFREMGFDSLSGVELRNRLIALTGAKLPTTIVFDYPTAAELARHLLEEVAGTTANASRPLVRANLEEPTAIVGMGCRFPGGANSPETLWKLVASGVDAISEFPTDRAWDMASIYHHDPEHPGTTYAREGGFLYEAGDFDASFFGIGPREALAMSPQQRLLLEVCWEALEKAGIDPHSLRGSDTGVFVGESLADYGTGLFGSASEDVKGYLGTGTAGSIVSGRVAYALGLEGVAMTINTACSSSLVAMNVAARSLRESECSLALVGGVTVMATPSVFIDFSRQRGTAPDGRCKSFSDSADGAGWGEGVGIVVLERLSDAERNGHEVLALMPGSAVNQDGASNGLTAPNGPSQQRVIQQALLNAGLSAADVDAVEAHGTGTKLGDPIEAQALLATYGRDREADRPLWLGSIKSNIGHTQAAAGIAGVIKMAMALREERLPRTLHAETPSGQIDWSSNTVSLLTEDVPWPRGERPRRAGVSSFGISGTNAHVILEEGQCSPPSAVHAIAVAPSETTLGSSKTGTTLGSSKTGTTLGSSKTGTTLGSSKTGATLGSSKTGATLGSSKTGTTLGSSKTGATLGSSKTGADRPAGASIVPWVVSARGERGLCAQADRIRAHLLADTEASIEDVGLSLSKRAHLEYRAVCVGEDRESLLDALGAVADGRPASSVSHGFAGKSAGPLAFLFTGQGAQRAGMGSELHEAFPVFRDALEEICGLLDANLGRSLRELMFAVEHSSQAAMLDETAFTQPALFALEVALFRLLESWDLRPAYLIGHSVGELAAAHVSGVLSLPDACTLVAARGRLMGTLPSGGAMVAVQATESEMLDAIAEVSDEVALAAVNGPSSVVISGELEAVVELGEQWSARGRKTRRLRVSHAFHSARMDGMLGEFAQVAEAVTFSKPDIPIVSNLSGGVVAPEELCSADYWVRHVRETVRFADGVRWLRDRGVHSFLELGPEGVLSAMVQDCFGSSAAGAQARRPGASAEQAEGLTGEQAEGLTGEQSAELTEERLDGLTDEPSALVAVAALRGGRGEVSTVLAALAGIWVAGMDVDWTRLLDRPGTRRVQLPTYAFQRERYWLDSIEHGVADARAVGQASAEHPLLGAAVALAQEKGWLFTGRLSLQSHPWLADHVVLGNALFPGTAFLELALHAGAEVDCDLVSELTLQSPLVLPRDGAVQLQVCVGEDDGQGSRSVSVHSRPEPSSERAPRGDWTCHALGTLARSAPEEQPEPTPLDGPWPPPGAERLAVEDAYERLAERGLDYGHTFQGLAGAWRRGEEIFAEAVLPEQERERASAFGLHPALLDAALHAAALAHDPASERSEGVGLPFCWSDVRMSAGGSTALRVCFSPAVGGSYGIAVADGRGRPVVRVGSLATRTASAAGLAKATGVRDGLFQLVWKPIQPTGADVGDPATTPGPVGVPDARSAGSTDSARPIDWVLVGIGAQPPTIHPLLATAQPANAPRAYGRLAELRDALATGECSAPEGVLLDCTAGAGELPEDAGLVTVQLLAALREWLQDARLGNTRLVLLTHGAVAVREGEDVADLAGAAAWGLVRCAQAEHPGRFMLVDIDAKDASWRSLASALAGKESQLASSNGETLAGKESQLASPNGETLAGKESQLASPNGETLAGEESRLASPNGETLAGEESRLASPNGETPAGEESQLAIRNGERFVARLLPAGSDGALSVPPDASAWRLDGGESDTVEGLAVVACPEGGRTLRPEEIRIEVRAAGVNFKDVLIALGVYPGEASIGNEAAGVVLEVGSAVEGFVPGDRVAGLFSGAFAALAVTDARLVMRIPEQWSFAEAASVPLVFLTAYYALVDLADVQPGERLLLHAAAGGVGMAALQLARHLGAEVFATASPGKWDVLERAGLDPAHIAGSRDLDFRKRFLARTASDGVDVVLNSLAGEFVDASLELLPRGGRFLEIGKTDVRDPLEIACEHAGVDYRAFDLMDAGPARIEQMLAALMDLFAGGKLSLPPIRAWDMRRAPQALRHMSQARHVGKIVLTSPPRDFDAHGTVLITGGTGGLGSSLAKHLVVNHGVKHLLLASRTGRETPGVDLLQRELAELGASVRIASCDVSRREQLQELLSTIAPERPLRAVVHAAGLLDDGLIGSLTSERTRAVLAPKLDAAWHLHELTAHMDIDAFVLFSSVAGTLGAVGQGNYAAANAFLEALATHRRAHGLPALAISWGAWEQSSGMTSRLAAADIERMASSGMLTLSSEWGLELFDLARADWRPVAVAARLDGGVLRERAEREELPRVFEGLVRRPARRQASAKTGSSSLADSFARAPEAERGRLVLEYVRSQAAAVLGHTSAEAIDVNRTFKDLGFDSLAAVELRNKLGSATGLGLPATLVFDHPMLDQLAAHIREELSALQGARKENVEIDVHEIAIRLSSISAEDARRTGTAARLREILAAWEQSGESDDPSQVEDDLSLVADEEIFELIDREFGVS